MLFLLRTSCAGDFRSLCPGVALGGGRAILCLQASAASLSPNCRGAWEPCNAEVDFRRAVDATKSEARLIKTEASEQPIVDASTTFISGKAPDAAQ